MAAFTIEVADALMRHATGDVDQLSDFQLSGSVNLGGIDPDPNDRNLMNIISTDETINVNFSWTQTGIIWRLLDSDLKWECRVFLERLGTGDDIDAPTQRVNFIRGATGAPFVVEYTKAIALRDLTEGLYMVSATLMLKGPSGEPTRIAAFADLGKLQVYNAHTP